MSPLALGGRPVDRVTVEHRVTVDPFTGAASLDVPIPVPPGRAGVLPALSLRWSSSGGASPFGVGWSLAGLPSIGIDTRRRLPRWDRSDDYQLAGDEIVPWLELVDGAWRPRGFETEESHVVFYRLRTGGSTVRIERWTEKATSRIHFRTRDAQNAVTVFGARPGSNARVADPADETRTYLWLPEVKLDAHGNALWLEYAVENLAGVDRSAPAERRGQATAQRYLKSIRYANAAPFALDSRTLAGDRPAIRWCFQVAFDYGDHRADAPAPEPDQPWPARADAFSTGRPGFDLRTYRLCRRILSFHDIPELGDDPTLVGELVLEHDLDPAGATLRTLRQVGHRRDAPPRALPPLRMTYAPAATGSAFVPSPDETLANVPAGLARRFALIDLFGEGLPGILAETDGALYWKPNLGDGRFGPQTALLERPAIRPGSFAFGDPDRDGNTNLSQLAGRAAGFFELDRQEGRWQGYRPFSSLPHVEALGGRAQWVDLNGDGRPDVVIARADHLVWFPSEGDGFAPPVVIPQPPGMPLLAEDPALDFFFADMSGDGLVDLVRVQNGRVEYWPNLGNGRFGDGIVLDGSPWFEAGADFDASRLRFVDLDGSGTTDLVYLGRGEIRTWINASGNALVPGPHLRGLPVIDNASTARVLDFLGDGRPCLVWSSPLPGGDAPLQYLPLAPAVRPRLLLSVESSVGGETRLAYASSARHYLRDQAEGRSWSTRLPSHVTVVERQEIIDHVAGTRSVSRLAYHDGYYDGDEREFRGFGQVDVVDAQARPFDDDPGGAGFAAPALTRTWFHLGTPLWNHLRPDDVYQDPDLPRLPAEVLEGDLGPGEAEDAYRALAGRAVRREVFAIDAAGQRGEHPFELVQMTTRVRKTQPAAGGARAAWSVLAEETLAATYEQEGRDPRVRGEAVVATDAYDLVVRDAEVTYARRPGRPRDAAAQDDTLVVVRDHGLVDVDTDDRFELGIPVEGRHCELGGVAVPGAHVSAQRLRAPDVAAALAAPLPHHVPIPPGIVAARLHHWGRSYYWDDAGPVRLHHEEVATLAEGFVPHAYGDRVDSARLAAIGYRLDAAHHWASGDTHHFAPAEGFFQPAALEMPDGAFTRFGYDPHGLVITSVEDPRGNRITADLDYHQVAPWRIIDPNGAIAEVRYDPLGFVIVETDRGTVAGQPWGMALLAEHVPTPATNAAAMLADPLAYVQRARSVTHVDLDRAPVAIVRLAREELVADGHGDGTAAGPVVATITHLDALGRVLQEKVRVDPGLAIQRDASGQVVVDAGGRPLLAETQERWRSSGHVVYDAKQRPVRSYQPFFTPTWGYEGDRVLERFGVTTLTLYDAIGRPVRRDFPDGSFEHARYRAWTIERADRNDTVEESTYRLLREGRPPDDPERQAYEHAKRHHDTPTRSFLDGRGLEVAALTLGGATDDRRSEARLDVSGLPVAITDPRGLVALTNVRDMLGRVVHATSVDAGDGWTLHDARGRVVTTWDARGVEVERDYDTLDRPITVHVTGLGLDHRVEERVYGEDLDPADAVARNAFGRLVTVRDQAGEAETAQFDPAGAVLRGIRRLRVEVIGEPDLRQPVPLGESFTSAATFDALARPRRATLADGTVREQRYRRDGGLARVTLTTPDGALVDVPIITGTEHDARGQRESVRFGNGVEVHHDYQPETFRLARQVARRGARVYQDIQHAYDPVGNLVRIHDHAHDPGPTAIIRGTTMPARRDHVFDAHYRLIRATGRVHQALLEHHDIPGTSGTIKGTRHLSLDNGAALETFTRMFEYDAGGNLRVIRHAGASRTWATALWVSPTSNRALAAADPNGLPVPDPETRFDAAGNILHLDHLRQLEWSWRGTLARAVVIERADGADDDEAYSYGADHQRVCKRSRRVVHGGQVEEIEKVYLGDCERKRILRDGVVIFERWTSHVSDGVARVAVVHRWVQDTLGREVDTPTTRIHYQLTSHQGSSALELDGDGGIISYEEYFPYGGTAFIAGDRTRDVAIKEYRYSGKERDDATSLYYYGYRYYAPWIGRWMSPDPLGPVDDLNLYQFVRGDPIGNTDPDGLQSTLKYRYHVISAEDVPADVQEGLVVGVNPATGDREWHTEDFWAAIDPNATIDVHVVESDYMIALDNLAPEVASSLREAMQVDEALQDWEAAFDRIKRSETDSDGLGLAGALVEGDLGAGTGSGAGVDDGDGTGTVVSGSGAAGGGTDSDPAVAALSPTVQPTGDGVRHAQQQAPRTPPQGKDQVGTDARPSVIGGALGGIRGGPLGGAPGGVPGGTLGGVLGAALGGVAGGSLGANGTGRPATGSVGSGESGTGTSTAGVNDLPPSVIGSPAPPGLTSNGEDPNGVLDGETPDTRVTGEATRGSIKGGSVLGVEGGVREGQVEGSLEGRPAGTSERDPDLLDALTDLAAATNFAFTNKGEGGGDRGVRGGGSSGLSGWFAQALYIAGTILSWVAPGAMLKLWGRFRKWLRRGKAEARALEAAVRPAVSGRVDEFGMHWYEWAGGGEASFTLRGSEVSVDGIRRGTMAPAGSGGEMLADSLRAAGMSRPTILNAPNVLQKSETSTDVIENVLRSAATELGGTVGKVTRGVGDAAKHSVRIEIHY